MFAGSGFGNEIVTQIVKVSLGELLWQRFYPDGEPNPLSIVPAQMGTILKEAIKKLGHESKQADQLLETALLRFGQFAAIDTDHKARLVGPYAKQHW